MDVFFAFIADLVLGDPYSFPHPVRGMGWMITKTEGIFRKYFKSPIGLKFAGTIMAVAIPGLVYAVTLYLLKLAKYIHPVLYHAVNILLIYTVLSVKNLAQEAGKVYDALKIRDIPLARKNLSCIVGRDTHNLDEKEITRAAVETVAENTVDGILSPLFYVFLGGAPLGMAYKAVNTLDSMVGYKNENYLHFGWASARLDDFANFIPARLAGILIPVVSALLGFDGIQSVKITLRDRYNHTSPNAGFPEAAVAGALKIQLGGPGIYFGKKVEKPTIGDPIIPLNPHHIHDTIKIMYMTAFVMLAAGFLVKFLIGLI